MGYEREAIKRATGYVPGKQPRVPGAIKLNTNENPYPPCDAVMAALHAVPAESLRKYPPPFADAFRATAARLHGLEVDQVMAVNGGDELLRLAISTFVDPGGTVGVFEPSYSLYPVLAELHGAKVFAVDTTDDFGVSDVAEAAARFNDEGARLVFLVNPHAPSGRLTPRAEVLSLARALHGVLVVDEAYVDFVAPELGHSVLPLLREGPEAVDNVLLLRTLSKGYGLAGLRFGYGLGHPALIAPMLTKTRDSYNVDVVSQALAVAALEHQAEAQETWRKVQGDRAVVRSALTALGFTVPESQSNFLLATVPAGESAAGLTAALDEAGVLVRYFAAPRLDDKLRITIGTPEENARLLGELTRLL